MREVQSMKEMSWDEYYASFYDWFLSTQKSYYLSSEESAVLELISRDALLTQKQIQNSTGYSLSTVKRIMARLQKEGVITRIGNTRSGK